MQILPIWKGMVTALVIPSQNMMPLAVGIFGGYVALTALLLTLAITRHDRLIPLSRAIAGRYHKAYMAWVTVAFLAALLVPQWRIPLALELTSLAQLVSLGVLLRMLMVAVSAAVSPRKFELDAVALGKKDVTSRIVLAFEQYLSPSSILSIRGKLSVDDVGRMNPKIATYASKMDGMVSYRPCWKWILKQMYGGTDIRYRKVWLAQNPGAFVRRGNPLWMGVPRTLANIVGQRTVNVVTFDVAYWRELGLAASSSYISNDLLAYQRTVDLFASGFEALGMIRNGAGATYADMWPALGCPEAFELALAYETLVKNIARLPVANAGMDAGELILVIVGIAMERQATTEAVRFVLDRLKDETFDFWPEKLGLLILRQGFFPIATVLSVWAAMSKYWLSSSTLLSSVADWFSSAGITPSGMGQSGNLFGALAILSGQVVGSLASFNTVEAQKLANEIKALTV